MTLEQYNQVKKGDKITASFDSAFRRNNTIEFIATGKNRAIKSHWAVSRITLKKEGSNFKCYLYLSKQDKISLAIGNLATSNLVIL